MTDPDKKQTGLDSPAFGQKVVWAVVIISIGLGLADFMYHKHGHFEIENVPAFYGIFGFLAFIFVVFVGVILRKIIMRDEDYYERD